METDKNDVLDVKDIGVFHRFGLVSHILSVLEINPDQKIYVMETSKKNDYSTYLH